MEQDTFLTYLQDLINTGTNVSNDKHFQSIKLTSEQFSKEYSNIQKASEKLLENLPAASKGMSELPSVTPDLLFTHTQK